MRALSNRAYVRERIKSHLLWALIRAKQFVANSAFSRKYLCTSIASSCLLFF